MMPLGKWADFFFLLKTKARLHTLLQAAIGKSMEARAQLSILRSVQRSQNRTV